MKILILGGSRFVGPLIIKKLLKPAHSITVFNRGNISTKYDERIIFIKGDRDNGFNISNKFDVVIDTNAYTGRQTKLALEQLKFDFFLHFSTVAVYKKTKNFPLTENSPLGDWPIWEDYNKGKVECELALKNSGIKYATIRPVYILGPANYIDREHFIYSRIKDNIQLILPGDGQAKVKFIFSKDVASSIVLLAEKKLEGVFNCGGDEVVTLVELVEMMGKIVGKKPRIKFNPKSDGENFNEEEFPFANETLICNNHKLKKLGIVFAPLKKGLKEDYDNYYRNRL